MAKRLTTLIEAVIGKPPNPVLRDIADNFSSMDSRDNRARVYAAARKQSDLSFRRTPWVKPLVKAFQAPAQAALRHLRFGA